MVWQCRSIKLNHKARESYRWLVGRRSLDFTPLNFEGDRLGEPVVDTESDEEVDDEDDEDDEDEDEDEGDEDEDEHEEVESERFLFLSPARYS